MEAAGDIGAGDDVQQGIVITQCPDPESFAEVTVEIDDRCCGGLAHWDPIDCFAGSACRSIFEVSGASSTQMIVTSNMATA